MAASESKGRAPKLCREALAYFEGFKPGKTSVASIEDADSLLSGHHAEFLAILIPNSGKPKTKPVNWRQECLNARAERDAALSEVAELQKVLVTLEAKIAHRAAIQQAAIVTA